MSESQSESNLESKPAIKVVLDTNVFVSSLIGGKGNCAAIIKLVVTQKLQLYYSAEILAECKRVFDYARLAFTARQTKPLLNIILNQGIIFEPEKSAIKINDEDDRAFYDAAKQSDSLLITGNLKHYPKEDFIINPADFLGKHFPEHLVKPKIKSKA
ncbi:MAG: putative toxin-antitoxin system toxin component, PIN family [Fibromonadales bacterium]|nr:putative toxin-antitoxin system toxin component, PIN family [Fibromonadales bacterium]